MKNLASMILKWFSFALFIAALIVVAFYASGKLDVVLCAQICLALVGACLLSFVIAKVIEHFKLEFSNSSVKRENKVVDSIIDEIDEMKEEIK